MEDNNASPSGKRVSGRGRGSGHQRCWNYLRRGEIGDDLLEKTSHPDSVDAREHPRMLGDADHIEEGGHQAVDIGELHGAVFGFPG